MRLVAGRGCLGLALIMALAACGVRTDLKPQAGKSLPVAAYGTDEQPGSPDLLKPVPQADPGRSFEPRSRSEERADDPFDLPPPE